MERVKRKESLFVESVVEGLWELLEDKSFEKISVSELVERAGIGRVSFYRNFSNKEEVLKRSFNMDTSLVVRTADRLVGLDGRSTIIGSTPIF